MIDYLLNVAGAIATIILIVFACFMVKDMIRVLFIDPIKKRRRCR